MHKNVVYYHESHAITDQGEDDDGDHLLTLEIYGINDTRPKHITLTIRDLKELKELIDEVLGEVGE